ncbi:hypothetical protein VNI00_002402 [Paramarasmius palmivorus]|uniref:PH domain-containing protein n=1 Tax=Paramarasmius palmivorus TaxID=297713 RepID=A0AAW0E1A1_9AGAR
MDSSTLPFRLRSNSQSNNSLHDDPASRLGHRSGIRSPTSVPNSPDKRNPSRASLLVMASDALNFNFGRRRKSVRQPVVPPRPMPIVLPDVIEISAARKDEEVEERGRLREQAAQALGLSLAPEDGTVLDSLGHERIDSRDEPRDSTDQGTDQDTLDESVRSSESAGAPTHLHHKPRRPNSSHSTRSPLTSSISVSIPPPSPFLGHGRSRSGSMPAVLPSPKTHGRSSSIGQSPIPPFPTTPSALRPFTQQSSTFPKYYPPSSLRIFALSKQWKTRYMVLSSPPAPSLPSLLSRGSNTNTPSVSYLHLFKSTGEEKEIERLEINEDSVVFVSEEDVGGRKHVIKVGGVDVGAMRKDLNHEEGGRTMWYLQMTDPAQSQKWIASIKNAILNQRSMRAGLGHHSNSSGIVEPRGDMDVVLSMRAQGIVTPVASPEPPTSPTSHRSPYASSPSSIRSHTQTLSNGSVMSHSHTLSGGSSQGNGAVSALKGLFSAGNRPRSSSRATSICSDQADDSRRESVHSSILGTSGNSSTKGNSLMNLLRSNTLESAHASSTGLGSSTSASTPVPIPSPNSQSQFFHNTTTVDLRQRHLERKIIDDPNALDDELATPVFRTPATIFDEKEERISSRAAKAITMDAISLQPPPRKRWTAYGAQHPFVSSAELAQEERHESHHQTDRLSVNDHVHQSSSSTSGLSISPGGMSGFSFGTPEQRPRSPSMVSVSTVGSGENGRAGSLSGERSSIDNKFFSPNSKRRSRQLPQRLTPPSNPPPPTPPGDVSSSNSSAKTHPYATVDGSPSRSSRASIPSFSKRASVSSAFSINSHSSAHSHANSSPSNASHTRPKSSHGGISHSRPSSSHRASMSPPPRPAPTFALPPAPVDQEDHSHMQTHSAPSSAAAHKQSFRESISSRSFRLSLTAPKPPPNMTLPPRPDEVLRRRAGSTTATIASTMSNSTLYSIPGSPVTVPTIHSTVPSREPTGPLPPTPTSPNSRHVTLPLAPISTSPAPSRAASIKQRLRILSAPSPSSPTTLINLNSPTQPSSRPHTGTLQTDGTPSGTPQTEKSSFIENNPSFITLASPVSPSFPTPKIHTITPPEPEPELTSLSPPPRRASKRISAPDTEPLNSNVIPEESPTAEGQSIIPPSLSRHGSVISLGIVTM